MTQPATRQAVTFAEYLEAERHADVKHELVNGEVFAMAGGTPEHAMLAANVIRLLGNQLVGKRCAVYTSDLRVRVEETDLVTYPDVTIVCGALRRDPDDRNTIVNPSVIIEVLSESTAAYDRGEKFAHYRRIATLGDYVLVVHARKAIEHYRRNDDGSWTLRECGMGGTLLLEAVGCSLQAADVFRDELAAPT